VELSFCLIPGALFHRRSPCQKLLPHKNYGKTGIIRIG
jgi:hypothetical protein